MSTGHRSMPIRCAPDPGEALDSWLEFTAARLACPFTDVLSALGLPNRETERGCPGAACLDHPAHQG